MVTVSLLPLRVYSLTTIRAVDFNRAISSLSLYDFASETCTYTHFTHSLPPPPDPWCLPSFTAQYPGPTRSFAS